MVRIAVVDDHPVTLYGLKLILSQKSNKHITLVASFTSGNEVIQNIDHENVDILLVDVQLPDMSGYNVITYLKGFYAHLKFGLYTSFYTRDNILQAIRCKANGIMSKAIEPERLLEGICDIMNSDDFVNCGEKPTFSNLPKNNLQPIPYNISLTEREREILDCIIKGLKNKEISEMLNIASSTVEFHRKNLYRKMEVNNVADLFNKAQVYIDEGR
jgi:DNA-binding NarL/FixJ family response regulator